MRTKPKSNKGKPRKLKKLRSGQIVMSAQRLYKVEGLLNGKFGDIYTVHPQDAMEKEYVMKTKMRDEDRMNVLGNELAVYEEIQLARIDNDIDRSRFITMIDKGKTTDFKFIVLELVACSIAEIQKTRIVEKFTVFTIAYIARETLRAIESLHKLGFVHRNLHPRNFFVGLPPNEAKMYLVDFGLARKIHTDEAKRRKNVHFVGTNRYSSRSCHQEKEQCRADDLESWFYTIIEINDKDSLIWRRISDIGEVHKMKQLLMTTPKQSPAYKLIPVPLTMIIVGLSGVSYSAAPDYQNLHKCIDFFQTEDKRPTAERFIDWLGQIPNPTAGVFKTEHEVTEESERAVKRRRSRERKKRDLEEKLAKIYQKMGVYVSPDEVQSAIREKVERKQQQEKEARKQKHKRGATVQEPEKNYQKAVKEKQKQEEEAKKIVIEGSKEKVHDDPKKIASKEEVKVDSKEKVEEKLAKKGPHIYEIFDDGDDEAAKKTPQPPTPKKDEDSAKTPPRDSPLPPPTPTLTPPTPKTDGEKNKEIPDEEKKKKLAQMLDDYMVLADINEMEKDDQAKASASAGVYSSKADPLQKSQMAAVPPVEPKEPQQSQMSQLQQTQLLPPTGKDGDEEKKGDDKQKSN